MEINSSSLALLTINYAFFFFQLIVDHASRDVTVQEIKCLWATSVFFKRNALMVGLQASQRPHNTSDPHITLSHVLPSLLTNDVFYQHGNTSSLGDVAVHQKENPLTKI